MKLSFKRITSSGNFIPEIDGLRFIAIVSVVLFHLNAFFNVKINQINFYNDFYFLNQMFSHGHLGVPLFFIISGFILGMPFAKNHLQNGKSISIKNYFLRRLTRLEPPYILVMTILLFASVFVAKSISLKDGIISYFSSFFYAHNFVFPGILPKLNAVTWSLEVEVQFYILAPLISYIFLIKSLYSRRLTLLLSVLFFIFFNNFFLYPFYYISIINYIQYFLIGFLLVDVFVTKSILIPKTKYDFLFGIVFFISIWFYDHKDFSLISQRFIWEIIQIVSMFFLYYYILIHKIFKFISFRIITNIGGMCYSIYLLHFPIISLFGNPLLKLNFTQNIYLNLFIYSVILIILILIISSVFFLIVERPCMNQNWYKNIFKKEK